MAFRTTTKTGKKIVLLNPSEKVLRYARQLKKGQDHAGKILSDTQRAYRSGYLDARTDSAKAFKAKKRK